MKLGTKDGFTCGAQKTNANPYCSYSGEEACKYSVSFFPGSSLCTTDFLLAHGFGFINRMDRIFLNFLRRDCVKYLTTVLKNIYSPVCFNPVKADFIASLDRFDNYCREKPGLQ